MGGTSPLKATTDSDVPLSPSDAKAQINNVNKSDEKKNLDQAVNEAKQTDGIQLIKDTDVKHQASKTSEEEVKKDYQNQADTIKKQVEDQKQKLADYNTKKQQYDQKRQAFIDNLKKEGLWKDGTTDPSKLAQNLILNSEPNATLNYEVLNNAGSISTQVTDNGWNFGQGAYGIHGGAYKQAIQYQFAQPSNFKGDFLRLTYTNLNNSSYNGKKITKIVETFSDKQVSTDNPNANLQFTNDPTIGWIYDGVGGITASIQLYDENNQLINIDEAHPGYLTVSSLNSFGKSEWAEKAQLLSSGEAMQIPESAVTVHKDNIVYSDRDINTMQDASEYERKTYSGWDNANSPAKIFASGLFKVTGNQIKIRSFYGNNDNSGAWFAWSTTVPQTSFDAEGPQKPTATIHYHDNVIQIPATITVKYVDQETGKEIPDTQFEQKGNEGDSITYTTKDTIDKLQSQDYKLVSDEYTGKAGDKLSEANNGKTYVVTLRKQHEDKPITPEVKDGTQTYHFVVKTTGEVLTTDKVGGKVGENVDVHLKVPDGYHLVEGQTVPTSANIKDEDNPINILVEKDPTPTKPSTPETKDGTQTIHIIDKKTGNVLTTVVKGGKIGENIPVNLKVPKGYHLVQGQKLPTSVNIKDKDNAINVYVEKDEAKPAVTTPSNNNNSKATPAPVKNTKAPATIANASVKAPSAPVANNTPAPAQQATLPQTGNSSSTAGIVAGSTLLATMATLGIAYRKRKN